VPGTTSRPEVPEEIRTDYLPEIEAQIARMTQADHAEDQVAAGFDALRATLSIFKAERDLARVGDYADLVKLTGDKAEADEFFLPAYVRASGAEGEEDAPVEPLAPAHP
jgi:hypothetical protein